MTLFCPHGTHYQVFSPLRTDQKHPSENPYDTLVFIHGVGLDLTIWRNQVANLQAKYQIITYDLLGHGLSPNAPSDLELGGLTLQLNALLDHLKLKKVHLIGFSLGGLVARIFAIQFHHKLQSLTLMSSVFNRSDALRRNILKRVTEVEKHGPSANLEQALTRWFSNLYTQTNSDYINQLRAQVLANNKTSYSRCYRLFGEGDNAMHEQLNLITCPTLVTTGELDPGSTPAMSYELAEKISSATAIILPDARHMMPVEHACEVSALLHKFVAANSH